MKSKICFASIALVAVMSASASAELTTNGGFETGDTSGWAYFPTAESVFGPTGDANTGSFGGELFNINTTSGPSGAVIKQANIGIGDVSPGDLIDISFSAKGDFLVGGVAIAEFFSEMSGGGSSSSEILGGGPLFVATESDYVDFAFQVTAGPDVSGGVTLQFVSATGGATGSLARLVLDDVSVTIVPEPTSLALCGLVGVGAAFMQRRRR